jgi:hypothetical protein
MGIGIVAEEFFLLGGRGDVVPGPPLHGLRRNRGGPEERRRPVV